MLTWKGNLSIEVSNSQILNLTTDSISWSASEGLEIDVSVFLSEGKARPILLAVSSEVAGGAENLQEILIEANPGRRVIDFSLGNPETTEITIQAIPVQWTSSIFSQNITTESVAAPYIDPSSIKLEAIFNPEKPSPGSRVLVTITLSNDDDHITQSGTLRLISSSERTILAESTVPSLMPGSVVITEMSISEWIERDNVDVEVQWSSDGVISTRIYSIEPNIDDQGLELPFDILAAGYGILAGILIILVGTFSWRAVSSRTPNTSNLRLREAKESQSSQLRIEKREIECSFCDQRLMVPNDHVGGVRCPSCSMEFMVGGPDESNEESEKLDVVKSSDDILHCPTCDQALRVQIEKRPVMSRCPVCKTQFMAEAEGYRMSGFSEIEEMYLKTMFEIHSDNPAAIVKTTQLADIKGVSAASVTEMIQRLSSRDMVTHIPYRGCRLTPSGFQLAARIKRREILLEILLTDVIGFDGDVHGVACKMEHAVGSDLESTLDRLLGYPEFSIEGKRIPSVERDFETTGISTLLPLSKLPDHSSATVELIISSDSEAVTIRECGITIGSVIETSADSRTCDGNIITISDSLSMRILARINSIGG